MSELPPFLGSLPGWITAGGVATLVWVVISGGLGFRKLHNADEANIRDHYADEVKALREKLNRQEDHFINVENHLREMIAASDRRAEESDRRHEECETARQALRIELSAMHGELAGLKRQISRYSADRLVILQDRHPSDAAPEAAASAPRVKRITEDGDK